MNKCCFFRYGAVILLSFCIFRLAWWFLPNVCDVWELQVSDQLMRLAYTWQGKREASPDIVHIDLDDQSVASIKYSKNDPRLYTELINILAASGVKTILIDMVFPKCAEESCDLLAEEVRMAGNVHLPVILSTAPGPWAGPSPENPPAAGDLWSITGPDNQDLLSGKIVMSNYRALNEAAAGLGHMNCPPDHDGVYRRIPLLIKNSRGLVPSLALKTACDYLGVSQERIRMEGGGKVVLFNVILPDGRTMDIRIPINRRGQNRINFCGPWNNAFAHYSFATILNTGATPGGLLELTNELEDSLVIVSDVSTGSRDFGPVPLSSWYPLSGLHGNLINSILTNDFLAETRFQHNFLLDIILILLLTTAAVFTRGYRLSIFAGMFFSAIILTCLYLFLQHRVLMPVIRPSMSFVLAVLSIMLMQFLEVQKEKQYIRATLTNYFAPSLMEKILNDPELIKGVSRKELTVLFSDIVGFTSWSSTRDAQEIHQTLNRYFEEMAEIVFAFEGTIDKYIGDGLMVFFGDPNPCSDHALRAVMAAQAMQARTGGLKEEWEKSGGMPIEIRIGIHSGEVVVGNMGSHSRMDYTVIGSNVNLAQRLESNCPPGGILVSEQVRKQVEGRVAVTSAGNIKMRGLSEPVPVYTVDQM